MDLAERYFQLSLLGRETFLESVAHGALVRRRDQPLAPRLASAGSSDRCTPLNAEAALASLAPSRCNFDIYPLVKKPGGAFVDLFTVGRTSNNDIQLDDLSVSRFHAFFRRRHGRWQLCDAGSCNGTQVGGVRLPPRCERDVTSETALRFGRVEMIFYAADALFEVLSSRSYPRP